MVKTILNIEGMYWGGCGRRVNEAIKKNLQVEDVQSFHKENRTEILSQAPLDEAAIKAAIDSTGYTLVGITVE